MWNLNPCSTRMFRSNILGLMLGLVAVAYLSSSKADDQPHLVESSTASYRVPVDLVFQHGQLFVGNSRTGTVSRVNPESGHVTGEWTVAMSLSGLATWHDHLLLLDDEAHQLKVIRTHHESTGMQLLQQIDVAQYPVEVVVSENEEWVVVSSLWSRQLTVLKSDDSQLIQQHRVDLPFAARSLLFLPEGQIVAADAFGGHLAIVDPASGTVLNQRDVYGHNIRGLGLNQKNGMLMVACQTLDANTFTTYERIFWGVLMQNGLHSLPLSEVLSESADNTAPAEEESQYGGPSYASPSQQRYPLGTPSIGSGDPGAMVVTDLDTTLLLISGVDQVAFRTASHLPFERLKTGRRPEAICMDDLQQRAFIANRFDDSITVVSLSGESPTVTATLSLGPVRPLSSEEQGEQKFYDATVSLDGWFSCHSCHTDGHTNGQRADTFGDEDRGAPKKVVSLLGTASSGPWAWNGSKSHLEEQIKTSLIISMQTQMESDELPIEPLAAYLRTLSSPPSIEAARGVQHERAVTPDLLAEARHQFDSAGCRHCHSGDAFTSQDSFDVGIHDEMGETYFNPPSLRGISQRAPYFHDGRAKSLDEVLKSAHHDAETPLTTSQVRLLTLFLESL